MFTLTDFVCDYCGRSFTRKHNLQTHIENCHINFSCKCDICGQSFGSPAGLQLHLSRGHNRYEQPFPECDLCGRIFTRKQNIMSHMITVHLQGVGPEIRCKFCEKVFTTDRNLKRHVNQIHNPNAQYPTCDLCKKVFKGKHSLIAHIQAVHNSSERDIIKCELCNKIYTNNRNLKRHIEMFHGEKEEFKCDICPKVYTSNQSLKRHSRKAHNTDNLDEFTCATCTKPINGRENLESHIQVYHKQDLSNSNDSNEVDPANKVSCHKCGRYFEEEPLLRQHIKHEHSFKTFYKYCKNSLVNQIDRVKQKNNILCFYNCEFCSHVFDSVFGLKVHMRINHDREYCLSTCNVCFKKFYSKESVLEHKKICVPPANVNSCSHCDKLFTDISSLQFHTKIFHPQTQIADSHISSTNLDDSMDVSCYKCGHCNRVYYSERSLKHHVKLKHTTDEAVECEICGKVCSNKYYLASHSKIVHNNSWSKCDYCDKQFKSKRNIRRHIEYTHLGMQRYKCIECETLFKEKRSLRKHVRTKHPDSVIFPQCQFCQKRFESAKSCKIHLKLLHSFNMNTYPCHMCSVSFSSNKALGIHLRTKHLAEDDIYKCQDCNLVFKGQEKFEQHNEVFHVNLIKNLKQKIMPRCIICMKDFSTRKSLKRHIKKFHAGFDPEELADFGTEKRNFDIDCEDCIKNFNDSFYHNIYQKLKHLNDSIIFKCENCNSSFNTLEYSIQRYKITNLDRRTKMVLSELCTAEMSEEDDSRFGSIQESMEPESTTQDIVIKQEPDMTDCNIKSEPMSP